MLRLRRYRVLLICALVITVLLYHVSKNSQWDHSQELWHSRPNPQGHPKPKPPPPAPASKPDHEHEHEHEHRPESQGSTRPQKPPQNPPPQKSPPPAHKDDSDAQLLPNQEPTIKIPQLKTADAAKGGYGLPTKAAEPPNQARPDVDDAAVGNQPEPTKAATVPGMKPPSTHDDYQKQDNNAGFQFGRLEEDPVPTTTVHWQKPKEWFPVPEESLIMLPTGKPKPIPSVQFAFGEELPAAKEKREERLAKVKAEAQHAWSNYKKYAWTHDEIKPVTKKHKDPFCGWAATLVDSLDTLWIMGLKDEFDDAVEAVKDIDFTTTPYREDIPVFETIIRYLGGLVGAFDVTGQDDKYRVLLDKAVELAEILMSVFDTPNRLPILYYSWKPINNVNPKRASASAGVAELGSMSMEFTRLAQLTGKQKYYDAIARITNAFEDLQNRENGTAIPGIFPQNVDASGCNKTAPLPSTLENSSEAAQKQASDEELGNDPVGYSTPSNDYGSGSDYSGASAGGESNTGSHRGLQKRNGPPTSAPGPFNAKGLPVDWQCVPQNLTSGSYGGGSYSMGGNQDSAYEYFPKQYLLLGGLEPKYRTMHEKTAEAVKQYLLFRPMAEGDPDILFSAKAYSTDGTAQKLSYEWEVTHLTCFLGGMFGLGGKIFDRPEDVEIGIKLADGCVWAYEVMPSGIMPEYSSVLPCKKPDDCHFDEATWYRALDSSADHREKQMEDYYTSLAQWKKKVEEVEEMNQAAEAEKQAEELKRQAEGQRRAAEEEERRKRPTNSTLPAQQGTSGQQIKHAPPASGVQRRDFVESNGVPTQSTPNSGNGEPIRDLQNSLNLNSPSPSDSSNQKPLGEVTLPPAPVKPQTHLEYVTQRIQKEHIPSGFVTLNDRRYILRYASH